jgi:hypothetical protein
MTEENKSNGLIYAAIRCIECFSIALFIFGTLWEGTEVFNLSTPQFLMLYGGTGVLISEALARIFSNKKKISTKEIIKPSP